MALVATINGKRVYSNKAVRSVSDKRIDFEDGSFVDQKTMSNKGPGFIRIEEDSFALEIFIADVPARKPRHSLLGFLGRMFKIG